MKLNPKPATRKGQTMRTIIFGLSGSGKTLYALETAKTLVDGDMKKVLVIDTENESSGLYSDEYPFQIQSWEGPHDPKVLADLIRQADMSPDFDVIIVDGISPFWDGKGGMFDLVQSYSKGDTRAGWAKAGVNHESDLKLQITNTKSHLIVTCRGKNFTPEDSDAALTDIKVKPVQRDTVFYEFNTAVYVYPNHSSKIVKTRCKQLHDAEFSADGGAAEYAKTENDWLSENVKYLTGEQVAELKGYFEQVPEGEQRKQAKQAFLEKFGMPEHLTAELADIARQFILSLVAKYNAEPWDDEPETELLPMIGNPLDSIQQEG